MGKTEQEALSKLRQHAESNIIPLDRMKELEAEYKKGETAAIGDNPLFSYEIPIGYRVVFSVEEHLSKIDNQPVALRHISISVNGKHGACPSVPAVNMIMHELGFKSRIPSDPEDMPDGMCCVYIEGEKNEHPAINILEEFK